MSRQNEAFDGEKAKEKKDDPQVEAVKEEKTDSTEDQSNSQDEKDQEHSEAEEAPEEEKASAEDEDLQSRYMRLAADFQNFKRRTEKEKSDIYARANEKLVTELLEVADNFERALTHTGEENRDSFAEGMNMIFKQFKGVLEKSGLEEIEAEGLDFDPNFHHAVMTENSVEYDSGKVTQVLQRGYLLNGRVIRPAMVKVAE